ncbi:probable cytochrome P450 313a3 [Drosophila miranda]|uniref:probable cytochrome P450 313a3 n=1 Tax=Drosophila miranda TaxID=7229 RepID=UPI0007E7CDA2|nr:probable cytochrome P450 313a3 [Drosophila miranda]
MYSLHLWITVGILAWIYFLWSRRRFYLLMLRVKGPAGYPFLGVALEYLRNKHNMEQRSKNFQEYGPTNLTWLGSVPVLITCEPNVVQDVLTSPHCLDKSKIACNPIRLTCGPAVFALNGSHWVERRKQMNPSFRHNVLMGFLPLFNEETRNLISLLETFVGQGEKKLFPELINWSFRTSIQSTMGSDVKDNPSIMNGSIQKNISKLIEVTYHLIMFPWLQNRAISTLFGFEKRKSEAMIHLHASVQSIIQEKLKTQGDESKESLASSNIVINRAMDFLRSGDFSYEDVKSECVLTIIAGLETSAITVYNTLILLAMFPEYQDTAFEELKDVFPNVGDFEVSYDDLQKLVYMDRVLNESLRLLPPLPLIPREVTEDLKLSNGILIPKGVTVAIDIFNTHRNKDFWGLEADTFNPDNFLPEHIQERHPYVFIPFNRGKRNCTGRKYAEISSKIALAKILRNFRLSTSFRFEDLSFVDNIVLEFKEQPLLEMQYRR